ncbi:MAG: marA [Alphaproteobacteria bacterium]|jgi:AraC-like DNA-binding protein|nr:marA [Alphaproteobacteria bacterium]
MARTDPHNHTEYRRAVTVPGLTLMRADFTTHGFAPHSHDALVIAVTEEGGSEIKSRGVVQRATQGTLFVFNPDEPHAGWMGWSTLWRYRSFYLTESALDIVREGLGIRRIPYFTANLFTGGDLIKSFAYLHRALERNADSLQEEELLFASFGKLFERHGSKPHDIEDAPQDHQLLGKVIELMRQSYADTLPLETLAAEIGLTKFQLIGLFNRGTGLSPHAYLTQLRLRAACRSLKNGASLAVAASDAGFYDQSAMTRHFKRAYGITPLQYRSGVVG